MDPNLEGHSVSTEALRGGTVSSNRIRKPPLVFMDNDIH